MKNRTFILFMLSVALLPGCGTLDLSKDDQAHSTLIVGTWTRTIALDGGMDLYGEVTYSADGTSTGFGAYKLCEPIDDCIEISRTKFTSRWAILGGILENRNIIFSPALQVDSGNTTRDRIDFINARKSSFTDLASGRKFTMVRIEQVAAPN